MACIHKLFFLQAATLNIDISVKISAHMCFILADMHPMMFLIIIILFHLYGKFNFTLNDARGGKRPGLHQLSY